ncbi:MAG TPA: response regulator transcription factor [Acidimicrobiales bacterium]|nr:response regulator transcription factor [Acidimicrobiales bacterium]
MATILIVEDEDRIASFLQRGLAVNGFSPVTAATGAAALARLADGGIDLVLLDLGLPDLSGVTVLRELREAGHTIPVIVLTARDDVATTAEALEAGAEEYVTKPFSVQDLLGRIRDRLRTVEGDGILRAAGLALDLFTNEVVVEGQRVQLTRREAQLLAVFLERPHQPLSHEEMVVAWTATGGVASGLDHALDELDAKLGGQFIRRGGGFEYRLGEPSAPL